MSVVYTIHLADPVKYPAWLSSLGAGDDDMVRPGDVATDVTERVYPEEGHHHHALLADEVVTTIDRGNEIEEVREPSSFFRKLLGRKEINRVRKPYNAPHLLAFRTVARTLWWSQVDGERVDATGLDHPAVELALGEEDMEQLHPSLRDQDSPLFKEFCVANGLEGSVSLTRTLDRWMPVVNDALNYHHLLVIECWA